MSISMYSLPRLNLLYAVYPFCVLFPSAPLHPNLREIWAYRGPFLNARWLWQNTQGKLTYTERSIVWLMVSAQGFVGPSGPVAFGPAVRLEHGGVHIGEGNMFIVWVGGKGRTSFSLSISRHTLNVPKTCSGDQTFNFWGTFEIPINHPSPLVLL